MQRIDIAEAETGDILAGISILDSGKLVACEGDLALAQRYVEESFTIPSPSGDVVTIDGVKNPDEWVEWAPGRLSNQLLTVTEPYEDDDGLYDIKTGKFIGDAENPPLPNPGA